MGEAAGEVTGWGARPAGEEPRSTDTPTGDPEVDQLVGEIEVTRVELTGTVEQIGDRLDPGNIVAGAKASVRDATVGKVEEMASSAGDMVSNVGQSAQEAGSGLVQTIRRNPIPAAMAGIGLGWLAMSARSSGSMGSRSGFASGYGYGGYGRRSTDRPGAYGSNAAWDTSRMGAYPSGGSSDWSGGGANPVQQASQKAGEAVSQVQQRAGETAQQVGQKAGETVSQVQQTAGRLADDVGRTASQVPQQVSMTTRDVASRVGEMVQQNPLAAGAVAVAIGAAVGMALPVTPIERKVVAGPAGQALQQAETAASEALGQVEQKARDVEQQARAEDRAALS
jgi:ElaB/YqjD/DUF883 family membrane-anchored ribosome-binding protein